MLKQTFLYPHSWQVWEWIQNEWNKVQDLTKKNLNHSFIVWFFTMQPALKYRLRASHGPTAKQTPVPVLNVTLVRANSPPPLHVFLCCCLWGLQRRGEHQTSAAGVSAAGEPPVLMPAFTPFARKLTLAKCFLWHTDDVRSRPSSRSQSSPSPSITSPSSAPLCTDTSPEASQSTRTTSPRGYFGSIGAD